MDGSELGGKPLGCTMSVFQSRIRVESDAFEHDVQLVEMDGREAISQLFEFDLLVTLPVAGAGLVADEVVASEACLVFEVRGRHAEGPTSDDRWQEADRVYGIICQCEDLMLSESYSAYRLKLVPRFWRASLVQTLDIFMDITVADIIRQKLELLLLAEGTDYEIRIDESRYSQLEFVVQYKETDLTFLSRLTEHFGLSFFFEHHSGRDVLVFTDANSGFQPVAGEGRADYFGRGEQTGIYEIRSTTRMVPRLFVQRDYNYRQPAADLTATAEMPTGSGGGIVEYGAHFKTEAEGQWLADMRAEEQQCARQIYEGRSAVPRLRAGASVRVEGHPTQELELLLTEVVHRACQSALMGREGAEKDYENEFRAIAMEVPYRPPRRTPRPRINGVVTGIVEGSGDGEYAEVDDQGRYRVRFMFDTSGADEAKASRPVRMMQPHSGAGYGMHFPLRPGTEVLITFLDGDPDRPIIAGTVPNPQTASPVAAGNATKNVIRTGGGNEIDIDDQEGSHRIKLTTPTSSTTFQLGAPNSPEKGAMLETMGASSTVAISGCSTVGAFKGAIDAFGEIRSSGDIATVAKRPGPEAAFMAGVSAVSALVSAVETTIGLVEAGMTAAEKAARQKVVNAQEAATEAAEACQTCLANAEALLADAMQKDEDIIASIAQNCSVCSSGAHDEPNCQLNSQQKQQLQHAQQRIDTANAYLDANAAVEESYVDMLRARQMYNLSVNECATRTTDQDDIAYGDKLAEREQAYEDAKQAVDDNEAAKQDALTDLNAIQSPDYQEAQEAIAACEQDSCANVEELRDKAERENDSYNDLLNAHGPHKNNCTEAKTYLGLWSTVSPLLSAAMFLYSKIKRSQKAVELGALWTASVTGMLDSWQRPMSTAYGYATVPLSPKHVLGAQGSLHLSSNSDLLVSSEKIVISGLGIESDPTGETQIPNPAKGKVGIVAMEEIRLASKDQAEIAAQNKLQASAHEVDVLADDKLVLTADPRVLSGGTGTIDVTAKSTMTLQSQDDNIELKTTDDQHILLDQGGSKLEITTPGDLEATAAKTVKITGGDSDDAGEIAIAHGSGPSITVTKDSIVLKVGSNTALELKDDGAVLKYGTSTVVKVNDKEASVIFGSNSVKVTSSGIEEKGTQIKVG